MRIEGHSSAHAAGTVVLPRPGKHAGISLIVTAWPVGSDERARLRFPMPEPKVKGPLLHPKTRKPVKEGGKPLLVYGWEDRGYLEQRRVCSDRRAAVAIVEALRADPSVTFESLAPPVDPPRADDHFAAWRDYADALNLEFAAAGLSDGDLLLIYKAAADLSNMTADRIDEAAEAFLSEEEEEGGPEAAQGSTSTPPPGQSDT